MIARLTGVVVGLIALVHVYWAFGGNAMSAAAIPEHDGRAAFEPGPVATLTVAAGLGIAAAGIAAAGTAATWGRAVALLAGIVFLGRAVGDFRRVGLFKRERASAFARNDTWLYTPLCLALSAGSFFAAMTKPQEDA